MSQPDISVVIPVYNRGRLIRHTLESVRAASPGLTVETIVVDDGSATPVADDLTTLDLSVTRIIRQPNRGLLFARLAGLDTAMGRHVLFLDSDDLVSPDKLRAHVTAQDAGADVSYTDQAGQALDDDRGAIGPPDPSEPLPEARSAAEFFISIQPAPHSPAFRTEWLRRCVVASPFPPSALFNPVAEIWFYHICSLRPARVCKCHGLALGGRHPGPRLTNHWERLGVASLAVQEAFARTAPYDTAEAQLAHRDFAAKAFQAWRRLPRGFSPEFTRRQLNLYRRSPILPPLDLLGGGLFRIAASCVGPVAAGRIFRWRNPSYAKSRTLDDETVHRLLADLPPP